MSDFALYAPGQSPIPSLKKEQQLPPVPTNTHTNQHDFYPRTLQSNSGSLPSCNSTLQDVVVGGGGIPFGYSNENLFSQLGGHNNGGQQFTPLAKELQLFLNVSSGVPGKLSHNEDLAQDSIHTLTSYRKRPHASHATHTTNISTDINTNSHMHHNIQTTNTDVSYSQPHKRMHMLTDVKPMHESLCMLQLEPTCMLPTMTVPSDYSSATTNIPPNPAQHDHMCSSLPSYTNEYSHHHPHHHFTGNTNTTNNLTHANNLSSVPHSVATLNQVNNMNANVNMGVNGNILQQPLLLPQNIHPTDMRDMCETQHEYHPHHHTNPVFSNLMQPIYQHILSPYNQPSYTAPWTDNPNTYEQAYEDVEDEISETDGTSRKSTRQKEKRVIHKKQGTFSSPATYVELEEEEDEDDEADEDGLKGLKLYCSLCKRHFASRNSLQRHKMHLHYGSRPYHCGVCNQNFAKNDDQQKHLRLHNPNRPYSCPYCAKKFSTRANCVVHERSHTGEKPYQCSFCYRSFAQISARNNHQRTHTKERPFLCACGKSFAQSATRTAHIQRQCTAECAPAKTGSLNHHYAHPQQHTNTLSSGRK